MKIRLALFSALALTAVISCRSAPSEPGDTPDKTLIGDWAWVSSEGGLTGGTHTPLTEGYTEYYSFRHDSVMEVLRVPDTLYHISRKLNYWITRGYDPMTQDTQYFLMQKEYPAPEAYGSVLMFKGKDTIIIGDDAADGLKATWVREYK